MSITHRAEEHGKCTVHELTSNHPSAETRAWKESKARMEGGLANIIITSWEVFNPCNTHNPRHPEVKMRKVITTG